MKEEEKHAEGVKEADTVGERDWLPDVVKEEVKHADGVKEADTVGERDCVTLPE